MKTFTYIINIIVKVKVKVKQWIYCMLVYDVVGEVSPMDFLNTVLVCVYVMFEVVTNLYYLAKYRYLYTIPRSFVFCFVLFSSTVGITCCSSIPFHIHYTCSHIKIKYGIPRSSISSIINVELVTTK